MFDNLGQTGARAFGCCCFLMAVAITMSISITYLGLGSRASAYNNSEIALASGVEPYDNCGGIFADETVTTNWGQVYKFCGIIYMIYASLFIATSLCLFFPPAMSAAACCLGCTSCTTFASAIVAAVRRFNENGNTC